MFIRCLLKTTYKPNIQNGISRCDKTLNEYITRNGESIKEVISDYGKGIITKSEVYPNKIVNTLSNGDSIVYTKNHIGDVVISEGNTTTVSKNPNLWQNLQSFIFKGF